MTDGHFGCFHFLAVVNNAAVYIHVRDVVWTNVFISLVYIPRNAFVGSYGTSVFNHLRNFQALFQSPFLCIISKQREYFIAL